MLQGSLIRVNSDKEEDHKNDKRMVRPVGTKSAKKEKICTTRGESSLVESTSRIADRL